MLVGDDGDADEAVDGDDGLEEDAGPASIDLLEAQILEVAHLRRVRHRATRAGVGTTEACKNQPRVYTNYILPKT